MIIDIFEFIVSACFSRILGEDEDKDLVAQKSSTSAYKLQQARSLVNTDITETLLGTCMEIVFEQLEKYTKIIEKAGPVFRKALAKRPVKPQEEPGSENSDNNSQKNIARP